ncbi:MAG: TrpB-like pyridoxal-phosphate dependent enzyme, partial [Clostridiales bacterium]|nr:TrpB-like pyridoxal-phosphate dependent enzyme [Candidatus Coliplasma equi]
MENIPYKIYLSEDEIPKKWMNVRAVMKNKVSPMLDPETKKPVTFEQLRRIFCDELAKQELNDRDLWFDIPQGIIDFYKMYRPSPTVRAYNLERELGTKAHIYYKFEGSNTSGSHKLNSAAAQVYYAKEQGITKLTTETGAGQ